MQHTYTSLLIPLLLLLPVLFILTFLALLYHRSIFPLPPNLPITSLNPDHRIFPTLRAALREVGAGRKPLLEGYEKYHKQGQAFILPGLSWPEVCLPSSDVPWLVAQPEEKLSANKVFSDLLGLEWLGHGPDGGARHDFSVLRKDLTRAMGRLMPVIAEEVRASFEGEGGLGSVGSEEWRHVNIIEAVSEAAARVSRRIAFGDEEVVQEKKFRSGVRAWEVGFAVCGFLIRFFIPDMLKPVLAPMVAAPANLLRWRLTRQLVPIIESRRPDEKAPKDCILQWLSSSDNHGMSNQDIATKTLLLSFFATHTTALMTSHTLLNILTYASQHPDFLSELRNEAATHLPILAVREMKKLDSAIREMLRLSPLFGRGLQRQVLAPSGLVTPSGVYLPYGTHVCAIVSVCENTEEEFEPLRYYREDSGEKNDKQRTAVHISEDYLSFGLGRHACPGRFFAVGVMRVMLGYLLLNYDFEPLEEKPKMVQIGEVIIPSEKTTVKMRRRRKESMTSEDEAVHERSSS